MGFLALLLPPVGALSSLVTPAEAFSVFSNPAMITVRTMFFICKCHGRCGTAKGIGRHIALVAGTSEVRMFTLSMLVGASH